MMLKTMFWTLAGILLVIIAWLAVPTSAVFQPVAWKYDRASEMVTLEAVVSWPTSIQADWTAVIYTSSGSECFDGGRRLYLTSEPSTTLRYRLPPDLRECAAAESATVVLSWTALVFGLIPLRPTFLLVPTGAHLEGF